MYEGPIVVTDDTAGVAVAAPVKSALDIGIDTGNGRTHLTGDRMDGADGVVEYVMPSAVSLFSPTSAQILAMREAGPGEWGRFSDEEHMVVFPGELTETAVGELALMLSMNQRYPATTGSGDNDRYAGLGLKLALTAIARAYAPAPTITARVCTGLPVRLWTRDRADAVSTAWKGRHPFTYKGRPVTVVIQDTMVKAEGHAAWVTLDASQKTGTTLLLDLGARTAIGTLMEDGIVTQTAQAELGVDQVLDQLSAYLEANGNRALNLYERYQLLDAMVAGREYRIVANSKRVQVDVTAKALFAAAGRQIVDFFATQFSYAMVDVASISGGGVLFMGDAVQERYKERAKKDVLPLTDADRRTARGYYEQLSLRPAKAAKKATKKGAR